ncbi:MAG: hypothetical protein DSY66_01525 [Persephonella sp.]|nr:MAG: hypothetical protein DSY66_01525 [Persephonella sp.]
MKDNYLYVDVAVPVSIFDTFIYRLDRRKLEKLKDHQLIGRRVLLPFNQTKHIGIIIDLKGEFNPDEADFEIKDIEEIPDKYPIYTQDYIDILRELSEFYLSPIGLTLYYGIPDSLRWKYDKSKNRWDRKGFNNYILYPSVENIDSLHLTKRQREVLEFLISKGEASYEELTELGFSRRVIENLLKKGLIKKENLFFLEENKSRHSIKQDIKPFGNDLIKIGAFLYSSESFEKRLETYINIIANNIYEGKSSLLIFPNVKTLKKVYTYLKGIFGEKVYIYFDGLSSKKKIDTWFNLKRLNGTICLGTFSSIFIPIKNLSLIVLEEEHSNSYKMLRAPRFDIRNVAYKIFQKKKNLTLIYASSVPSVETVYLKAKKVIKSFKGINLNFPKANIFIKNTDYSTLIKELKDIIKERNNVLIITNRRGYSSYLFCEKCNLEIKCARCDIPLKVFKSPKRLECPICKTKYKYIDRCFKCDNSLEERGFGIEKLKENIEKFFPRKDITFETNIIDKEFLLDDFDTVINIFPEIYLYNNDFRSEERFFRSILYPIYKTKKDYFLITKSLDNLPIESLLKEDLNLFYKKELEKRKILGYPPFRQFILLSFEGKNLTKSKVESLFNEWVKKFDIKEIEYEGVFFAFHPYLRENYRYQIILKDFKKKNLLKELFYMATKKSIKLVIDVSPKEIK